MWIKLTVISLLGDEESQLINMDHVLTIHKRYKKSGSYLVTNHYENSFIEVTEEMDNIMWVLMGKSHK